MTSTRWSEPRSLFTPAAASSTTPPAAPADDSRFLSREACQAVANRFFAKAKGGGDTQVTINSLWYGSIRWGRNVVTSGGDTRYSDFGVSRTIRGAGGYAGTNASDDAMIEATVRKAEKLVDLGSESPEDYPDTPPETHPHTNPKLWFDETYAVDATARGKLADARITQATAAGLSAAGYMQASAQGAAVLNTDKLFRYYPITECQYSVTIRDPKAGASGWAGVDFNDWQRIDTEKLTAIAIDKCVKSRNPVAVEPGRYTAILEPQAVSDLFSPILDRAMDRMMAEQGMGPFAAGGGNSKIGQQVLDNRITVSADPMDPDCGFVPFDWGGEPYTKVNWMENGILKELSYPRFYGLQQLNKDWALPNSRAYRLALSGATSTIDQMITNTERGFLVTRFNNVQLIDLNTMLMGGNTRDGIWLIERGKIVKAVKNFRFTESPLFVFNNVDQYGTPQRVFRPDAPTVVPPIKVKDFSFTALMDAV